MQQKLASTTISLWPEKNVRGLNLLFSHYLSKGLVIGNCDTGPLKSTFMDSKFQGHHDKRL